MRVPKNDNSIGKRRSEDSDSDSDDSGPKKKDKKDKKDKKGNNKTDGDSDDDDLAHNVSATFLNYGRELTNHADLQHGKDLEPSLPRAVLSGIINAMLILCLSGTYGLVMFGEVWHVQHVALGVKMNYVSGAVLGLALAFSKGKVLMGGPDVQSAIFFSSAITKLGQYLSDDLGLPQPKKTTTSRRLLTQGFLEDDEEEISGPEEDPISDFWFFGETPLRDWAQSLSPRTQRLVGRSLSVRNLSLEEAFGLGEGVESRFLQAENSTNATVEQVDAESFCVGTHLEVNRDKCETYHNKLRATSIALVAAGSIGIGLVYLVLGAIRSTRYVEFIPRGIVDAFLACIGYKIFVHALLFCEDKPRIFIPAALVGVPFYFIISGPLCSPIVMVPLVLCAGAGAFYGLLAATSSTVDQARIEGLMFPVVPEANFWSIYTDALLKNEYIVFKAWSKVLPDLATMWGVLLFDGLGQLRMTEEKVPASFSHDWETGVTGLANMVGALIGASSGCSQLLLNVCNYGSIRNTKDNRSGIVYALICIGCTVAPTEYLNYLPRHFFGMLLFCVGSRFVAEHLWGSRKYLSNIEWLQIILIVGVFVCYNNLTWAMGIAVLLTAVNFITKYAKFPCLDGKPIHGGELASRERHGPLMTRCITHIANSWVLVLRLKGFCFFASVHGVIAHVRDIIEKQVTDGVPEFRRLKFLIFDCDHLDGIDSAASKDFQRLRDEAVGHGMQVLWSAVSPSVLRLAKQRGTILSDTDVYHDLQEAMLFIEQKIRVFRHVIEERWVKIHPMFAQTQELTRMRDNFEPFKFVFAFDAARFGCPWMYCKKRKIRAHKTILWETGMLDVDLFLIHTGSVGVFDSMPLTPEQDDWEPPKVIYKHGWFLNRQFLVREATRGVAVAQEDGEILCWNTHQWWRMTRERPLMASAIMEHAMRQAGFDATIMQNQLRLTADVDVNEEGEVDMSHLDLDEKDIMQHDVPHDLQVRIEGVEAAQFLKEFKLYEAISADDASTALPEMPRKIRDDLAIAFYTFGSEAGGGRVMLNGKKVKEALMYAGIFNMLNAKALDRPLDEKEFMAVGHETCMARLSKKQVSKIYNIFKSYDKDRSGQLDRDEMIIIFRETFTPNISEEEVNGICGAWDDNGSGKIDAKEFVGIVSRFIRKHEQDWNLLVGFREIMQKKKKETINFKDYLTVDHLMTNKHYPLSREDAEEMLWACDCFDLSGDGLELDFAGFVAGVLLSTEYTFGKLPPLPKKPPSKAKAQPLDDDVDEKPTGKKPKSAAKKKATNKKASNATDDSDSIDMGVTNTKSSSKKKKVGNQSKKNNKADSDSDDDIKPARGRQNEDSSDDSQDSSDSQNQRRSVGPNKKMIKNNLLEYRREAMEKAKIPDTGRAKLHVFLNFPLSSTPANVYSMVMSFLILASFAQLVITTIVNAESTSGFCPAGMPYPYFTGNTWCCKQNYEKVYESQGKSCDGSIFHADGYVSKCCLGGVQTRCATPPCAKYVEPDTFVYDQINLGINIVFTLEYFVRLGVCDALEETTAAKAFLGFLTDPLNICDLGATLPFWFNLIFKTGDSSSFRLLRLGRVMKVANQNTSAGGKTLSALSSKTGFFMPMAVVFFIIWGVYWRENNPTARPDTSAVTG